MITGVSNNALAIDAMRQGAYDFIRKPMDEVELEATLTNALQSHLLESELFGHERGSFTGAVARKEGNFELTNDGTLFLDELGEMPPSLQAKLLRVLQEGAYERVGGTQTLGSSARIIAATIRDLGRLIKEARNTS